MAAAFVAVVPVATHLVVVRHRLLEVGPRGAAMWGQDGTTAARGVAEGPGGSPRVVVRVGASAGQAVQVIGVGAHGHGQYLRSTFAATLARSSASPSSSVSRARRTALASACRSRAARFK